MQFGGGCLGVKKLQQQPTRQKQACITQTHRRVMQHWGVLARNQLLRTRRRWPKIRRPSRSYGRCLLPQKQSTQKASRGILGGVQQTIAVARRWSSTRGP